MMALIMTMKNKPQAVMMSFQKEYAERYDWLVTLFKDWAFTFMSSFLYYQDFDMLDDMQKQLYRQGMATFGGIAPTYHIELLERPTIVWDFHSLLLGVQMMFSFMLTDEKSSLKVCKHCGKAFVASRPNSVFCSGIMCIRAGLRIKTTLTNSSAIRKKADYEYRYYKANGNGTVQNRR